MIMDKNLKIATNFLSENGYGTYSEYTKKIVAQLMVDFAISQLKNCNLQNVSNNEVVVCDCLLFLLEPCPDENGICERCEKPISQTDC